MHNAENYKNIPTGASVTVYLIMSLTINLCLTKNKSTNMLKDCRGLFRNHYFCSSVVYINADTLTMTTI